VENITHGIRPTSGNKVQAVLCTHHLKKTRKEQQNPLHTVLGKFQEVCSMISRHNQEIIKSLNK
jgi:hypothetical protein